VGRRAREGPAVGSERNGNGLARCHSTRVVDLVRDKRLGTGKGSDPRRGLPSSAAPRATWSVGSAGPNLLLCAVMLSQCC